MSIKKIKVIMEVDVDIITKEAETNNLEDAISGELNWLHDSGMTIEAWDFIEEESN